MKRVLISFSIFTGKEELEITLRKQGFYIHFLPLLMEEIRRNRHFNVLFDEKVKQKYRQSIRSKDETVMLKYKRCGFY